MRTTDLRRGLPAIFVAPLLFAACASSNPPPDPGPPPPVPTETQAAETTAAPAPSAEPTMAPVATAEPTAAPVASVEPTAAPTASATAAAVSGPANANLRVGTMTVNGLTLEDLVCHADGLGLLGAMLVVGSVAQKKAALNACGKGKIRIEWVAAKKTVASVTAKGDNAKVDACVAKALKGTEAPFEGECAATMVLGK